MQKTSLRRYLVASLAAVVVFVGLVVPASPASALYAIATTPTPVCTTTSGVTTCTQTFSYNAADAYEWTPPAGIPMTVSMWGGVGGPGGSDTDQPWCSSQGNCGTPRGGSWGYGSDKLSFTITTDGTKITAAPGGAGGGGATDDGASMSFPDPAGSGGGAAGANYFTKYNGGRGGHAGNAGWSGAGGGGGAATVLLLGTNTYIAGGGGGGVGGNRVASASPGAMQGYRNDAQSTGTPGVLILADGGGAGGGGGGLVGGLGGIQVSAGEASGTAGNTGLSRMPEGATKSTQTGYTSGGIVFTWTKLAQTGFTETAASSALAYVSSPAATTTVTATGGQSSGAVGYATSTPLICSVNASTGLVTAIKAGDCIVTATKAADIKYDAATSSTTITVGRNDQAALVANAAAFTTTFPTGTTVTTTGGSGTGAVSYSSNTPAVCTVNASNGAVTAVTAGTCQILATKAADANYLSPAIDTVDILINKGTQTITGSVAPSTIAFTATATAAATAGSGTGANTYNVSTPAICSIDQTTRVITPITTGSCVFTVTKASDAKYSAATSAAVTLTITKGTQTTLVATPDLAVISDINTTDRITTTGGSGTGAVTYSTTSTGCAVNSTTGVITPVEIVSPTGAAVSCIVTATKAADANYNAATATTTVTIKTSDQDALIAAVTSATTVVPTTVTVSVPATGAVGGGNGTGAVSYASLTPTLCTVNASTGVVTPVAAGTCQIVATRAGDTYYAPEVSTPINVVISKGTQAALNIGLAATVTFPTTTTATLPAAGAAGGGTGTGAVSFATSTPTICSVNATTGVITPLAEGQCKVKAIRAASDAYLVAESPEETLLITKANQAALVASAALSLIADTNVTDVVSTTGGSGTGAVTYATSTPSVCSINATTGVISPVLLASGAAQAVCSITATKAGDSQYNSVTSTAISVIIKTDVQAALVLSGPTTATVPTTVTEVATGGSGTGALTYASADTTICTVVAGTGVVTPIKAGNCVITATKAADANYIPAVSNSVTIVVSKGAQASPLNIGLATNVTYPTTTTATLPAAGAAGGGTGTGAVSFATSTPAICSVNATSGLVTPLSSGNCLVSATRAATDSYLAATSPEETLVIAKANQAALTATVTPTSIKLTATATVDTPDTGTGSGSTAGVVTFATTTPTVCSVNSTTGVVTPVTVGTCTLNATKAGSDLYNPVTSTNINLTITKGDQAPLTATISRNTTLLGSTDVTTVSAPTTGTGSGSGTGAITYISSTTAICTVNASTGVITSVAFGTCSITANKAADTQYLAAVSAPVTLTINRPVQAALTLGLTTTATPAVSLGTTATLPFGEYIDSVATGGSDTGAISYAVVTGADFCAVDATTGIVTPVKGGACTIRATKAGTASYAPVTSNIVTVNVVKGDQDPVAVTLSSATTTYPTTVTASVPAAGVANGGNGTGEVTYASTTPTICSVNAATGVVTPIIAGTCKVNATRAGNDFFNPKTSDEVTVTIAKAAQPLALTISPASAIIGLADNGNPATTIKLTVGASGVAGGGNGTGTVTFSSTGTGCSVNATTGVVSPLILGGTCSVTATRAGDGAYLDKLSSNTVTVTVRKAQASLTLSTPVTTTPYGSTVTLANIGASTGALSHTSADTSICTVTAAGVVTPVTPGSCVITATRAGDATYAPSVSNSVTITIAKASQGTLAFSAPTTGTSVSLTSTPPAVAVPAAGITNGGKGTGARTFSTSTPTVCSINETTGALTLLAAGDCIITVTKAADVNYVEATSAPVTITVTKGSQGTLIASATPTSIAFTATSTVTVPAAGATNGGKGTGAVSFSVDPSTTAICSVNATTGVVTAVSLATGTVCKVLATRAGDANYNPVTTATPVSITITKGAQSPLTLSASTLAAVNVPAATVRMSVPTSGTGSGSGTGAVSYSVTGSGCSIVAATGELTATGFPDCVVTATKAADSNFNSVTSNTVTVAFTKLNQAPLVAVANPSQVTFAPNGSATVSTTGGSVSAPSTYAVSPESAAVCSVNSTTGVVTTLKAGTCTVVATKPEDAQYEPVSDDVVIVIAAATQDALSVSINKASVTWKNPGELTASIPDANPGRGSGTGAVTFRTLTPSVCSVDTLTGEISLVSPIVIGDCSVVAVKAADSQYKLATSAPATVAITKAEQDELVASTEDNTIAFGATGIIEAPETGIESGSGEGQLTYVVTDATKANCSVNLATGVITPKAVGPCDVYATKSADDLYAAAVSNIVEFEIVKGEQQITFTPVNRLLTGGKFNADAVSTLASAVITYVSTTPATCTVSGKSVTPKALGACTLVVSAAGDALYNAAVDVTKTFQITASKLGQVLTHTAPPATPLTDDDIVLNAVLSSGATPVVTIKPESKAVCSVVAGKLHGLKAGTCNYTVAGPAIGAFNALPAASFTTSFTAVANVTTLPFPVGVSSTEPRSITITDELIELQGNSSAGLDVTYATTNSAVCWVDADGMLHMESVGTCAITATSGDEDHVLSSSPVRSFQVTKGTQALTFTEPGATIVGTSPAVKAAEAIANATGFKLSATLSSGLEPIYRSLDPEICTVEDDGTVTWNGDLDATPAQDTCRVGISHPGTDAYEAIPEVVKSIRVAKPDVDIAPAGGVVKEPGVAFSLPRTGGKAAKGGITFNVSITSKTFVVKPQSKGLYIGPITADIIVTYEKDGVEKTQSCFTGFGIVAKDTKGKPIFDIVKETAAAVKAATKPYLAMPKYKTGSKPGYLDPKIFTNSASCTLNKEAFDFFKAGGVITAKAVVVRDRRWPTTYKRAKPNGTPIYPTTVVWDLKIG